jgi:cytochrome P450
MTLPDGPKSSSIVQTARFFTRPIPLLEECAARYGSAFTLRMIGLRTVVMVANPDLIRCVYTADEDTLEVKAGRTFLQALVGDSSVLILDGATHMRKRRLLLPPFHGERMHAYARVMSEVADRSIDTWPVGEAFRLHPVMQAITLGVIVRAVFGIEEGAQHRRLLAALRELIDAMASPLMLIPGLYNVNLFTAAPWLRSSRLKADVDSMLYAEIARRRAADGAGEDVLSLLLMARDEQGQPLSDVELRDELFTVLVAGYETTATALAWTFGLVLRHPSVLAKIEDELRSHAGDGPLDPACLSKLEYLDAVIKESLRLYPVVPMVSRMVKRPFQMGSYEIPPGVRVTTCIYLTHRMADLYPEPERFIPERFIGKKVDPYAWFPFGGGLRRCVGMAFSLYELKVVLARVLLRAKLAPVSPSPPRAVRRSVTLMPSDGTPVVLERRLERADTKQARPHARKDGEPR